MDVAEIKTDLRLTPDQGKNWGAVQTALHDMAQRRADRMLKVRKQRERLRCGKRHQFEQDEKRKPLVWKLTPSASAPLSNVAGIAPLGA
jgi:hypothetical protein